MIWYDILELFFHVGIMIYAIFVMCSYLLLAGVSFYSIRKYINRTRSIDYNSILVSPLAPSVSLLAPAYNEGETIIENVKSLLSIHYTNVEVIIINDGSKDDTIDKLVKEYQLEPVDFCVNYKIKSKEVRCVYKSQNPAFQNLVVIDKVNGGKADALNAGINVSSKDYILCIDVDCVLEQDALLKLMKPFLDQTDKKVIATGGVIRIANSCKVYSGKLEEVVVPSNFLARIQVIEYFRAFLLGRMAWGEMDALLLISGALGVFDKEIAIKAGGYDKSTVGEDMELIVRMRKYMHDRDLDYKVAYVPDPLCWTEAPESWRILGRQRNRWTRGTIETLLIHKDMFFNHRYGVVGLLSYPYWFFFEWLAPLIELVGIIMFIFLAAIGRIDWGYSLSLILMVYSFATMFSVMSLLVEEITFRQYKNNRELLKLIATSIIEPLVFHPFVIWSAVKGNIDFISGKTSWGDMPRKGFRKGEKKFAKSTP